MLATDRVHVLREAIMCCRKGGTISIPGVYVGLADKIPIGAAMNKGLTIKMGQTHVQGYTKPLLEKIEAGEIDPTFVITHPASSKMPRRCTRRSATRRTASSRWCCDREAEPDTETSATGRTMAPRAIWKGHLEIGQLVCPVALYAAASTSERVAFHIVNRKTGHRVRRVFVDAETGEPVERDDQAKGYETDRGKTIVLEEEELAEAVPESDKTLRVEAFIPCGEVDTLYFDRPYYLIRLPAD